MADSRALAERLAQLENAKLYQGLPERQETSEHYWSGVPVSCRAQNNNKQQLEGTMKINAWVVAALILLCPLMGQAETTRLLIVGDSWAEEQWVDGSHARVLGLNGYSAMGVYGHSTTESGSTAHEWKQASYLQRIDQALLDYPAIDTVQLTVGGNDFLNVWNTGMSDADIAQLTQAILFDLGLIIDYVLAVKPEIEILLSLYDYPNFRDTLGGFAGWFACGPLHDDMGQPTPLELNTAALGLVESIADLADGNSRIHFVDHFGLMQYNYGFVEEEIPPGAILLPGDIELPSPLEAMRKHAVFWWFEDDCFHLTPDGYDIIVQNLIDHFLAYRYDGEALVSINAPAAVYDGSPHGAAASTQPAGLAVTLTFDGQAQWPTEAGVYTVEAQIDQSGWTGGASATLVISAASQDLYFEVPAEVFADQPSILLSATADSGLAPDFALISGPAILDGNELMLTGAAGTLVVEASQPGNNNWQAAEPVIRTIQVIERLDTLFDDRFESTN
jgi:hypothetical protein